MIATLPTSGQELYINEVMASNSSTVADEDGDYEDWVELYYEGDTPLDLGGIGLSDDYDNPFRWVLPDTVINPGQFMIIWASGKDRDQPGNELHTNFSISASGEEVLLTSASGELIDELQPVNIPTDITIGRWPNGSGEWYFFSQPTPGEANQNDGYRDILEEPSFSHEPGFYNQDFELTINHPEPGVTLHYTTDGSKPTDSSSVYSDPLQIADKTPQVSNTPTIPQYGTTRKASVIRAKAMKDGYLASEATTRTYFVFPEDQPYSLSVISLSTNPGDLFNEERGIYMPVAGLHNEDHNYEQRGREWEREAHMELFEKDGSLGFSQGLGIRIHGGWTRRFHQKSLRLYARGEYGASHFNHRIFPDSPEDEYNRLLLRNSGNDWGNTMFRDAAAQSLVRHLDVETQAYHPAVLFINGEYWGIQNIRERYDKHYLERVYEVDPDNIDLLTKRDEVKEGDSLHYVSMIDYIVSENLSNHVAYRKVGEMMDIDNFLDYYTAQIYFGNNDWPHNNIDFWRSRVDYSTGAKPGHDGRWRWLLYDVDRSLGFYTNYTYNTLEWVTNELNGRIDAEWPNLILRNLLENKEFENAFINRMADHLNTSFRPDRVTKVIDSLSTAIEPEIEEHIARWSQPISVDSWHDNVNVMHENAQLRPYYVRQHYADYFNLGNSVPLTVDVSDDYAGHVKVNGILINSETPGISGEVYPWTGEYFENVPVVLKARPVAGQRFSHWEVSGEEITSSEIEISIVDSASVKAVFRPAEYFPTPFALKKGLYHFEVWSADAPAKTYPPNMGFVYMDEDDPGLDANKAGMTTGAYNLTSRTRINGLDESGFSFINTGNQDGNPGYPGRRLGGAVLALDTREKDNLHVSFQAGTVRPNSRIYNIRLQYRIGDEGPFHDLPDIDDDPVEYQRNEQAGHSRPIGPIPLPQDAHDEPMVQLLWRYYYTGERIDEDSGQRSKLNISEIRVEELTASDLDDDHDLPSEFALLQNYPNPFNPTTQISFHLPERQNVRLDVYDALGRHVITLLDNNHSQGHHQVTFDASGLASGLYLYRLQTESYTATNKMMLVK